MTRTPTAAITPPFGQRLRAAARMLTRAGDDQPCCSFCGKDRNQVRTIVCGPGVAICWHCASIVCWEAYAASVEVELGDRKQVTISGLLGPSEKMTAEMCDRAPAQLARVADDFGVDVIAWTIGKRCDGGADEAHFSVAAPHAADVEALAPRLRAAARAALGLPEVDPNAPSA
ncbi:MAG: hypothetical protein IPL88_14800 [Rhizobiales bacterium]|nr:hypothetical protein [Hyphomicrobiales bacterium]